MARLMVLFEQAIALGWVTQSERDRLRFVTAAEHARAIGTKNACGLFAHLVRHGLWAFATQDDEDEANARLKLYLYGPPQTTTSGFGSAFAFTAERPTSRVATLSEDAQIVRTIRGAVAQTGYRGDAFPFLHRQYPEWTRERWDRALEELARFSSPFRR